VRSMDLRRVAVARIPWSIWPLLLAFTFASSAGAFLLDRLDAVFGAALAAAVLWVAAVDLDRFEIPDTGVGAIVAFGLGWIYVTVEPDIERFADGFLRSLAAAGFLYAVRTAYRMLRGVEGLGLGDVKLAAAGALWLSWSAMPIALLIAVGAALMVVVGRGIVLRQRIDLQASLPLGAFLAPAIWVAWFASAWHY
jgi:leader peptidase (prepilin peptidase) / N-methyltransferase